MRLERIREVRVPGLTVPLMKKDEGAFWSIFLLAARIFSTLAAQQKRQRQDSDASGLESRHGAFASPSLKPLMARRTLVGCLRTMPVVVMPACRAFELQPPEACAFGGPKLLKTHLHELGDVRRVDAMLLKLVDVGEQSKGRDA
jgi:hypothetical protein